MEEYNILKKYLIETFFNINFKFENNEIYYNVDFGEAASKGGDCRSAASFGGEFNKLFDYIKCNWEKLISIWEKIEPILRVCTELNPTRSEGDYMRGLYYYNANDINNNKKRSFDFFKNAYKIGFDHSAAGSTSMADETSIGSLMEFLSQEETYNKNIKIFSINTLFYLSTLCYQFNEFNIGLSVTYSFLKNYDKVIINDLTGKFGYIDHLPIYDVISDWYKIYVNLIKIDKPSSWTPCEPDIPIFCIVADGGYTKWSGRNILTSGVGGSETWVIEMSRNIKKLTNFNVIVFCNCFEDEIFEGVEYRKLDEYHRFISTNKVKHCVISRFSEYIPSSIAGYTENIHVILHDLGLTGIIVPIDNKIKNIFCLSEWHKNFFLKSFPHFTNITHSLHYGIDFTNFLDREAASTIGGDSRGSAVGDREAASTFGSDREATSTFGLQSSRPTGGSDIFSPHHPSDRGPEGGVENRRYSFIYSSFPNRGLRILLKMWPDIQSNFPNATLDIFTDINNEWANSFYPEDMTEVKRLLLKYTTSYPNVKNHGWVSKKVLSSYWKSSNIWFYPCTFAETFCLTALEAALTKTLVITNNLAALQDTVGDRGVIIEGDCNMEKWQKNALEKILFYLNGQKDSDINYLIEKNYKWALEHSWTDRAKYFIDNYIGCEIHKEKELPKIDLIYYINLEERVDRKDHFLTQCNVHKIPLKKIERFNAINGKKLIMNETVNNLFRNCNYKNYNSGTSIMGNQLSHYMLFEKMITENFKYIIICQDDIVFKNGFCDYVNNLMDNIPDDAEIIHLGFHKYAVRDVFLPWDLSKNTKDDCISKVHINDFICKVNDGCHLYNSHNSTCYILTQKGARNYISYIINEKQGFTVAQDYEMSYYLESKDLSYASRYVLATTNTMFGSDIFENIYNSKSASNKHKFTSNNINLNYLDMYNWTNDLPHDCESKLTFVKMLSTFISYKNCNILEIGTYVGTSLIAMLQYLPQATATAIDSWKNYDEIYSGSSIDYLKQIEENNAETIFKNNIQIAGLVDKVTSRKGDSSKILIELLTENNKFDFIYVDGSHKCLDCYADCLLSWPLLKSDGIMAIDDYLYKTTNNVLDHVSAGVDHFLSKIEGEYKMLNSGYRIFIKKFYFLDLTLLTSLILDFG